MKARVIIHAIHGDIKLPVTINPDCVTALSFQIEIEGMYQTILSFPFQLNEDIYVRWERDSDGFAGE